MPMTISSARFGWVKQQPDFRDYAFIPPKGVTFPKSLDLFADPALGVDLTQPWNQSNLGSCGPNTLSEHILFDEYKDSIPGSIVASRLFSYYVTRQLMGTLMQDSGVNNRTMLKALQKFGWCDAKLWPYDINKFTKKPPQAAFDDAARRAGKIAYLSVQQDMDHVKACLVTNSKPFIFGFTVYESMLSTLVAKSGDVPMPKKSERVAGGHDVLIVGYDDQTMRFKFKNHWGNWGKKGYGTIPYDYVLNRNLSGDFWTILDANAVAVQRAKAA